MINPGSIMKLMEMKNKFEKNHPKVLSFFRVAFAGGVEEGTVIEMTVTRPGQEPISANIRVCQDDLELMQQISEMNM